MTSIVEGGEESKNKSKSYSGSFAALRMTSIVEGGEESKNKSKSGSFAALRMTGVVEGGEESKSKSNDSWTFAVPSLAARTKARRGWGVRW